MVEVGEVNECGVGVGRSGEEWREWDVYLGFEQREMAGQKHP